jgi:elongation factor P
MLEYNEITLRKYIIFENEPYEVLASHVFRKQQRKPVNATKLRSLITGRIVEHSFHVSDKVSEADISTKKVKYMYTNKGEYWFCDETNPANRFKLDEAVLGPAMKFIKTNSVVDALVFEEKIFGVKLPIKVELKVTEAANAVRGDTAKGGNKMVTLETGATITCPMFIKEGDIVKINTETGEYSERAS